MEKRIKNVNWLFLAMVVFMIGMQFIIEWNRAAYIRLPFYIRAVMGELLLLLPVLGYFLITRCRPRQVMRLSSIGASNVVLTVVLTFSFLPLLTVANLISTLFASAGTEMVVSVLDQYTMVEALLFIAVAPAVVEEFIFRGIFYGTYRRNGIIAAAVLSGFAFGCMHMNVNQFSYAFVLGIIAVLVIEATGSIMPAMIMHFTYNANSVILSKMLYSGSDAYVEESAALMETMGPLMYLIEFAIYVPLAVAGSVLGWFVLKQMARNSGRTEHFKVMFKYRSGRKNITIPYILAGVICIALMVLMEVF